MDVLAQALEKLLQAHTNLALTSGRVERERASEGLEQARNEYLVALAAYVSMRAESGNAII